MQRISLLVVVYLAFNLLGCATVREKVAFEYSRRDRDHLYELSSWAFEGRVAVLGRQDSWQANIDWRRLHNEEMIRISGPLGQGAVSIHITKAYIGVDEGEGETRYEKDDDDLVAEKLGFFVPVRSLRYWLLGLVEPNSAFKELDNGFIQAGWVVIYKQMQQTGFGLMPYKINVSNQEVRLKLIIDQWQRQG